MLKRAIVTLLAVLACAGSATASDGWVHYDAPNSAASIDFPGTPQITEVPASDSGGIWTSSEAKFSNDAGLYSLLIIRYLPDGLASADIRLDSAVRSLETNLGGVLISRKDLSVDGSPATDVLLRVPSNNFVVQERIILRGQLAYTILTAGVGGPPPDAERFRASLVLGRPGASQIQQLGHY